MESYRLWHKVLVNKYREEFGRVGGSLLWCLGDGTIYMISRRVKRDCPIS